MMGQLVRRAALVGFVALLTGCVDSSAVPYLIDDYVFARVGGTLFSAAGTVGLKQIHFEGTALRGKEVIVEGKLIEVGAHQTYMFLGDEEARLLVVLTNLPNFDAILNEPQGRVIRVLGTIDNAQKGLPFVEARALNMAELPGKA